MPPTPSPRLRNLWTANQAQKAENSTQSSSNSFILKKFDFERYKKCSSLKGEQCVIYTWCGEDCRLRLPCEIIYQKSKCVCLPFCIHLSLAPPTYNQALYSAMYLNLGRTYIYVSRFQARHWGGQTLQLR